MALTWRRGGAHVAVACWQGRRRRRDRGSLAVHYTAVAGEGMGREREMRRSRCAHPNNARETEATGGEEKAAARFGLTAKRRFREASAT